MRVHNIQIRSSPDEDDAVRLQADVTYVDGAEGERYWFEVPASYGADLSHSGNPWLLALLPLAMLTGEPLEIEAPVDAVLLSNVLESANIWKHWKPQVHSVTVEAPRAGERGACSAQRVATFFSCGVDSYYSLLTHNIWGDPYFVDDLIYVWGFDVPLTNGMAFQQRKARIAGVAQNVDKTLIPVKTNLRETRVERASGNSFGPFYHGYALGAIGLSLENRYRYILVPSNGAGPKENPWGTHPLTVPLLSTEVIRFIYDTPSATRLQKLETLAACETAWETLSVCFKTQGNGNCGTCEKCRRTQLGLEILGVRERFVTFKSEDFSLDDVPNLVMFSQAGDREKYYREMHTVARARGSQEIAAAIATGFRRTRQYLFWQPIRDRLWELPVVWRLGRLLDQLVIDRMIR